MPEKMTKKIFIDRSNEIHNKYYDYTLVEYKNACTKIKIICPEHGVFEQQPYSHLNGYGCKKCNCNRNKTEDLIYKFNKKYNNKFDYSLVEYKNTYTPIKIICPEHGLFEQFVQSHLKYGCDKCNRQDNFIKKSKEKHNNKYNYSLVQYVDKYKKVKIICPVHGVFEQTPIHHLRGNSCKKCADDRKRYTTKEFVEESTEIHGNKYDYSLVEYTGSHSKVKIICPNHGVFEQKACSHINNKNGCPICGGKIKNYENLITKYNEIHNNKYEYENFEYIDYYGEINIKCSIHGWYKQKISSHLIGCGCLICGLKIKSTEDFIKESTNIHNNKYDYSLVEYINNKTKLKIICPIHGIFEQTPSGHRYNGCPNCNESKGEREISILLHKKEILFIRQKTFHDCKNTQVLQFDFYLPEYNTCIEFDGIQHFKMVEYFGGEKEYVNRLLRDKIKTEYCKDKNIKLLRIRYDDNIEEMINDFLF
ncbi:DUF723 domain-containing protein [bacterium]|jgi:hypothetical protein|nr:DUF723 domain-containing protein [bacterium]